MNPLAAAFLVGTMTVLARWSKGEQAIGIENVIGVSAMAVTLAVLGSINRDLGRAFGALAVLGVALVQVPNVADRAGIKGQ